ncbi:MAG: hypothetical protein A2Z11_00480 [Candidatus Woykebacteria bacterium RBG_16_43_9]|uniref:Purine nucleoside phosphorylase n=1 Tax=Candidatus Woykebacteria bacterium RBG_16_43_9 TaxID=1802596 RepID=A0A1G1WEY8_9BACT|nr:MAG: hypothetical protein A2Z11_00480 [Candidatus Woykebacteria bacterium RBG_16_43_9]
MLVKSSDGIYTLNGFSNFKKLICGFSTKKLGDMSLGSGRKSDDGKVPINKFVKTLGAKNPKIVLAEQTHGNEIARVSKKNAGEKVKGSDGLITKDKNLFLTVFVADCLPIVAFDPKKQIVGIAHAGWRGTLKRIAGKLIKAFKEQGSRAQDILVGFGPGVEFCHYEVKRDVADKFKRSGQKKSIMESVSGKIYLDLKLANIEQLVATGVPRANLDVSLKACTYENKDLFSYRAGDKNKRFAAVIGLIG